ncbi:MAG: uracil-DNA glycosylase [Roseobacter sp.]
MSPCDLSRLGDWRDLPFFEQTWPGLKAQIGADTRDILPPRGQIFAALEGLAPAEVRVIILGQDPYPTPGHAHGLAFSADSSVRPLPRSLGNIYKEMQADIGAAPDTADLRFWQAQGVLLLNTVLTVPAHTPNGHARLGWQDLATQVLARLADRPRVYLLWGAAAQKTALCVDPGQNLKIETAHPSPLSARRGFFGSRPFSRTNVWLQAQGLEAISWAHPAEDP